MGAGVTFRITRWNDRGVLNALDGKLARNMPKATALLEGEIKRSMKGGGEPHVPSAPGEPPRVDTGVYRAGIYSEVDLSLRRVSGRVIAPGPQAMALEMGYAPGGLLPRPHLRVAFMRARVDIFRVLIGSTRTGPASLFEIKGALSLGGRVS